jgi:hypothetical protein
LSVRRRSFRPGVGPQKWFRRADGQLPVSMTTAFWSPARRQARDRSRVGRWPFGRAAAVSERSTKKRGKGLLPCPLAVTPGLAGGEPPHLWHHDHRPSWAANR